MDNPRCPEAEGSAIRTSFVQATVPLSKAMQLRPAQAAL